MSLESDIPAAVDSAVAPPSPPADPASTPATPEATPAPVEKPLASTPAPRSGSDRRSTRRVDSGGTPTVQATPASTASPTAEPYSVPPREEWEGILSNAREKAAEEARAELARSYDGLTPDAWNSHIKSYIDGLTTNPVEFHRWLGEQLSRRGLNVAPPPAPEVLEMPQPSLYADAGNGRTIPAYSADDMQQVLRVAHHQWAQEMDRRFGPLEELARESSIQTINAEADRQARTVLDEAKTWPYFDDVREDMARIMKADKRYSFEGAYTRAIKEKMPTFRARDRAAVLAELAKAPAATTAIDPSRPVISAPRKTKGLSLEERFEQELEARIGAQ